MSRDTAKHARAEKKKSPVRKLFKAIGIIILIVVIAFAGMIGFLSLTEYKPADREEAAVENEASAELALGDEFSVMTWNIGYGALGDNADFFMDGGTSVYTADKDRVGSNMEGIISETKSLSPDIVFYQEADINSSRSRHINEVEMLQEALPGYCSSFANNFKVAYLPFPVPPMGKVDSGIVTFSSYPISGAERVQLPIPFAWPVRMANLKRCVLISRVPIQGTDKELVLFNLHLEAYDTGAGKVAQTKMLAELLEDELNKGNYVIAGGDFNQIFSTADETKYPPDPDKWVAGKIDVTQIKGDWQFLMDEATPSCRSLDQALEGADLENFQYYLIDGFIVSGNIEVESAETQDLGFKVSDHNPVLLKLKLMND